MVSHLVPAVVDMDSQVVMASQAVVVGEDFQVDSPFSSADIPSVLDVWFESHILHAFKLLPSLYTSQCTVVLLKNVNKMVVFVFWFFSLLFVLD